jgi:excinuclease UvrABC ATPase subunit
MPELSTELRTFCAQPTSIAGPRENKTPAIFAATLKAKVRGYHARRLKLVIRDVRCEDCRGHGRRWVEMHFLPDVWVVRQKCGGPY